jgi:predicted TIM-barrel fold metal-dependent hydrolase
LARALAGGDENSGQDMGRLVYYSDMIRRETAAHLSFVHHSGKNKALGARGHSSLRAAVDTEIEISREEGAEYSTIKFVKQREMEMIDDMAFSLERVVIGIDKFADEISSCVVVPAEVQTEKKERAQNAKEKFVYEAIIEAVNTHGVLRTPYKDGPMLKTVTFDQLADVLQEMGYDKMYNKDGESNVIRSTKSVRLALRDKNLIGFNAGGVWLLSH